MIYTVWATFLIITNRKYFTMGHDSEVCWVTGHDVTSQLESWVSIYDPLPALI